MNVYFCDLCNESIPQADLELGRAVRRNERLICAACEAAMSSGAAHAAPAAPAPVEQPAPHLVTPATHQPSSSSSVAAVALAFSSVALVAGVGASAYLYRRLDEEAGRLEKQISDLERLAPQHALTVSANLKEEISERENEAAQARSATQALAARVLELEQTAANAAALERRIDKLDARLAAVDDLAYRVEHQTGAVDQLTLTVAELVAARARAAEQAALDPVRSSQPVSDGAVPSPPPASALWQKWVPDLESSDPGTRWQAVQALGETHDLAALPHLVPLLTDADIFVRMATCRSIANLGGMDAVPALIDTLEDEEAAVRDAALVALRTLTDQSIPFDPLARDADRSKRVKAWREWWEEASKELGKGKPKSKS
jgi:hypothetical protein